MRVPGWLRDGWPGAGVALFLATFINKVDRKGRASVPASFRQELAGLSFPGIVVFPAIKTEALEASGIDRMQQLVERVGAMAEFSDERDALSAIFADVQQLPFDGEGRIVLPPDLCAHTGIELEGYAAFVGNGATFQIWEPGRFERHQADRRSRARGLTLPPRGNGGAS